MCRKAIGLARAGRWRESEEALRQARELDSGERLPYLERGMVLWRRRAFRRALTDFENALRSDPLRPAVHNMLSWFLATCPEIHLRNPVRAVEHGKCAVELAPDTADYWRTLGVAHFRAGNPREAIPALEKAVEFSGGGNRVDCFYLSMARWQLGEKEKAHQLYREGIEGMPGHTFTLAQKQLQSLQGEAALLLDISKTE